MEMCCSNFSFGYRINKLHYFVSIEEDEQKKMEREKEREQESERTSGENK